MGRRLRLSLWLILSAFLVGQSVACYRPVDNLSPLDLALKEYEVSDEVTALARETAAKLFGARSTKGADFARELVETFIPTKGKDFAIIYNTGGFGGSSITDDPEWSGVVYGIQSELAKMGYTATVLEHTRSRYGLRGFLEESWDLIRNYPGKAPVLAAKIEFLTRVDDNLTIIITGRSFGAIYSNEVMRRLERNRRVHSIQAGRPFWYRPLPPPNSLVIKDNGVIPDSFSQGDLWTILRANFCHRPTTDRPAGGSIRMGPFFLRTPGHEYTWGHPGVRNRTTAFLNESFAHTTSVSPENAAGAGIWRTKLILPL